MFFLTFCLLAAVILVIFPTFMEIGVGVTILLFGILNLEKGFKIFTEGPLRKVLRKSTNNLFKSINIGVFATAILNSSSLISVLVISFISAGLISLKAGIGVVFGSNIGTTCTGWLVALFGLKLDIAQLAMPMIIFGILFILQKSKSFKGLGYITAGLGFFFLGVFYLKNGFDQYAINLQIFEPGESGPLSVLTYTGIGILATVILQSSSATLAIILTALSVNQITYQDALALAIGSNIGTTFTALLGSMAANQAGKKLALAHLIFNILTGSVALIFLTPLRSTVDGIATAVGIDDQDYTLKLAIFHTLFNLLGVLIMVPWVNQLIKILNRIIKDAVSEVLQPLYLNKRILEHPQSGIHALYKETEHLLDITFEIVSHSIHVHRKELLETEKISEVLKHSSIPIDIDINEMYAKKIKNIYSKVIKYASLLQSSDLSREEIEAISNIRDANRLIVKVIKDLEDFRKNLNLYMNSENAYIRDTYNTFRKRLLKIIRELFIHIHRYPYQIDIEESFDVYILDVDSKTIIKNINEQKGKISKLDDEINDIISELLAQKLIKSHIASSIWNDCMYVRRIGENLLEIMELMYTDRSATEV
jgi:phosphate:Na+ symporter